ncbi:MAG: hypothetical protein R3E32_10915 [Chitinophagales bacterium]
MKKSIFIAVVIGFALLGGSIGFLIHSNNQLKAENDDLKANAANKDGLQRTDRVNSYY